MKALGKSRFLLATTAFRMAPAAARGTAFIYEMATGNAIYVGMGGGTVVGSIPVLQRIVGGLDRWIRASSVLRNIKIGPYYYLKKILEGTGEAAHHLNQAKAFPGIPHDDGVAVALQGRTNVAGDLHRIMHEVYERFWEQFRVGGARFNGPRPTNAEFDQVVREGLSRVGVLADEVDELASLAKDHRVFHGYFDGPGGLPPQVPNRVPGIPR